MDTENKVQDKPPVANTAAQKAPEPTFDNGPSIVGRKDRKTVWILAIVLLLIVAAGGVGFGVWAYMDGNTQKEQLSAQVNDLQEQNSELQEQLASGSNTGTGMSGGTEGGTINTADYIYVGEWGIKIKISEGLSMVSYKFVQGRTEEIGNTTSLIVSGAVGDGLPRYADFSYNADGLGFVRRFSRSNGQNECIGSRMVTSDDEYIYCYFHPQVAYSVDDSESNADDEAEAVDLVQEMLLNAENYSAI